MTFDPKTDLKLDRTLTVSPAQVWRCWTEPELLKQWFAPKPVETIEAVIEPIPGGRFYTVMRIPEFGDMPGDGCVLLANPNRRLVWTNVMQAAFRPVAPDPGGFAFSADMTLTPTDTGCHYVIIVRHTTPETRAQHESMGFHNGWGTAATQMETLAKSL